MNPRTLKSLDRALARMEKRQRQGPRRFPKSAITLVLALLVGHQLLARLVPMVWATAWREGGWGGFGPFRQTVWQVSTIMQGRDAMILWAIGAIGILSLLLGYRSMMIRRLLWIASVVVILLNAGILFSTFRTSLEAASQGL